MHSNVPGRPPIELPAYYPEFAWYYPDCELETKAWIAASAELEWQSIDCGANIGYYSILLAQLAPEGRVWAVEPTSTAEMLARNVAHHALGNVVIERVALGRRSGRRVEDIHRLWGRGAERAEYDFSTVDELTERHRLTRLDCIKIDVDSYDFEVLLGAERTLARFDPWIIVELSEGLALRGSSRTEVFAWLRTQGYRSAALLDRENYLLKRSCSGLPGQIPLELLEWASPRGLIPQLKRDVGPPRPVPDSTRQHYVAAAVAAAAGDAPWFETCRQALAPSTTAPAWQLFQYASLARFFAPKLIIELGGWNGESTRAFLAGVCRTDARLVSFQNFANAETLVNGRLHDGTSPACTLHPRLPSFTDLTLLEERAKEPVLVFANDPAAESTSFLLCHLLPRLADRPHLVVVPGISDGNYCTPPPYVERVGPYALTEFHSARPDLTTLLDFTTRNQLSFHSADRSLLEGLGSNPERMRRIESILGPLFSLQAHWRWFSLNERLGFPHTFPSAP